MMPNSNIKILPFLIAIFISAITLNCGDGAYIFMEEKSKLEDYEETEEHPGIPDSRPPDAPVNVLASDGVYDDRIVISWDEASDAEKYYLYRSNSELGPFEEIDDINSKAGTYFPMKSGPVSLNYEDDTAAGLLAGVVYYYKIKAANSYGESEFSEIDSGFLKLDPPDPPASVSASDGLYEDNVEINWDAAAFAERYYIYRSQAEAGPYAEIGSVDEPATVFIDSDSSLENGVTYWYRVAAWNSGGYSDQSVIDEGSLKLLPPDTPANLTASDGLYPDRIVLKWEASQGAELYYIYRSESETEPYVEIASVDSSSLIYADDDPGLENGEYYLYMVRAWNQAGYSGYSNVNIGNIAVQTPEPPANIQATDGEYQDKIVITWSISPGAIVYFISRSETEIGGYSVIGSVSHPNAVFEDTDAALIEGTTYYYIIRAYNTEGYSEYSDPDPGFLQGDVPEIPENVQATDGEFTDKIVVTWDEVDDATLYYVYRAESENGTYEFLETRNGNVAFYNDTSLSLEEGVMYWYKIRSWNDEGFSNYSSGDSGYLQSTVP